MTRPASHIPNIAPCRALSAVRAVCFDLGGTVVRLPGGAPTTGQVAGVLGISLAEARAWMETGPKRSRLTCTDLAARLAHHFDRPDAEPRLREVLDAAQQAAAHPVLYDDAISVLGELHRRGCQLFALSNAVGSSAPAADPAYYEHFDAVFPSYDTGLCKPDPAAFALVQEAAHLQPHQLLHVGDSVRVDVHGAVNAGWHGVYLDRGPAQEPVPLGGQVDPPLLRITALPALLQLLPESPASAHPRPEVSPWI
jgi:FMN hydrolase / 5-amino-6-(5-phospho-D-ribitylamino)uracil phosphatase